jgi:hypothetical protein
VKIARCPAAIREVLEVAKVAEFFELHASVEEAISAI